MRRFVQLHLLTSYPPANLNRDDLGRPKTAVMGGSTRLRVSSQSLKRAWRTSSVFADEFHHGGMGIRTRRVALEWLKEPLLAGLGEAEARSWLGDLQAVFGEADPKREWANKELCFVDPLEKEILDDLVEGVIASTRGEDPPENVSDLLVAVRSLRDKRDQAKKDKKDEFTSKIVDTLREHVLQQTASAPDVGMFGRMVAKAPRKGIEAAVQVAHAITVHAVAIEDDYFTAVDELNKGEEDVGAGHVNETEFAAGLFYLYICVNRLQLIENLGGNEELAMRALRALTEAAATVSPTGKQNSFASRSYASYMMAEKGDRQPRSLAVAFLKPIQGSDPLRAAIDAVRSTRTNLDKVYGPCAADTMEMDATDGTGRLDDVLTFVTTE